LNNTLFPMGSGFPQSDMAQGILRTLMFRMGAIPKGPE